MLYNTKLTQVGKLVKLTSQKTIYSIGSYSEAGHYNMKITIKKGKLYDVYTKKFVEALTEWHGHGDHFKEELPKTKKVRFLPYKCECGAVLIDLHEGNIFTD
jgi:hypothetical protein